MRLINADEFELVTYTKADIWEDTFEDGVEWVLNKIDSAPTIEAEPVVHGEWKEHIFEGELWANYCSVCKHYLPYGMEWKSNYCPNCGAKMDAAEEK